MATKTKAKAADDGLVIPVRCDGAGCDRSETVRVPRGTDLPHLAAHLEVTQDGWRWDGRGRFLCPKCKESAFRPGRAGFTLVELLVVLVIVVIIAAVTLPVVLGIVESQRVDAAAQLVRGEFTAATARAQRSGLPEGLRFEPDPSFPLARLASGEIDPSTPLALSRVVPLSSPAAIRDGRVSVRSTFPAGFPATAALVLEAEVREDLLDATGAPAIDPSTGLPIRVLTEPTSWAWRVRLGDRLELAGRTYTVCGPMTTPNPEGFINYPGPDDQTGLDRGEGPAEWLLLVNGIDDDGDGYVDNGFDGRDQDGDGVVDNPEEWTEVERWGINATVLAAPYAIYPRPAPTPASTGIELAGAVIDATGWDSIAPPRSRLPIDRLGGHVDLVVYPDGRVEPASRYAPTVPAVGPLRRPYLHLWISNRESIDPPSPTDFGRLLTVSSRTGLATTGEADPADADGARRAGEMGL